MNVHTGHECVEEEQGGAISCETDCAVGEYVYLCTCATCQACMAGKYRDGCGGSDPGDCRSCPAGKYKTSSKGDCLSCPANSMSKAGSTSETLCFCSEGFTKSPDGSCPADRVSPVVQVSVSLPMSKTEFLSQQERFVSILARSAGVSPSKVKVVSVTESSRRAMAADEGGWEEKRLRAASVSVVTEIASEDPDMVLGTLTEEKLNTGLESAGLPRVKEGSMTTKVNSPSGEQTGKQAPVTSSSNNDQDAPATSQVGIIAGAAGGGGALLLVLGYVFYCRRRWCVASGDDVPSNSTSIVAVAGQIGCASVRQAETVPEEARKDDDAQDVPV